MDAEFWENHRPRFLKQDAPIVGEPPPGEPYIKGDPYPAVPAELKDLRHWVLWKAEVRDGKSTKVPKQTTGQNAKSNCPATWTDYNSVVRANAETERFDGISFVFTSEDVYLGIDLDNCIVDGKVEPWAVEILNKFKDVAYIEVSPSGNGIKIWTRAKLSVKAKHKVYVHANTGAAIEAYDNGRFFTVTGKGKYAIGDGQDTVDWLVQKLFTPATPATPARPEVKDTRDTTDIKKLIDNSRQRGKFHALMAGNWEGQGYGSHSEADMGLIQLLYFWTQDARHLDTLFRQSKLYREKWDERHRSDGATYGQMTIEKALSGGGEVYTPRRTRRSRRSRRRNQRGSRFQWL